MPIVFDEITADVTPPAPTTSAAETRPDNARGPKPDPQSLVRELQRVAERAERLNAD